MGDPEPKNLIYRHFPKPRRKSARKSEVQTIDQAERGKQESKEVFSPTHFRRKMSRRVLSPLAQTGFQRKMGQSEPSPLSQTVRTVPSVTCKEKETENRPLSLFEVKETGEIVVFWHFNANFIDEICINVYNISVCFMQYKITLIGRSFMKR